MNERKMRTNVLCKVPGYVSATQLSLRILSAVADAHRDSAPVDFISRDRFKTARCQDEEKVFHTQTARYFAWKHIP